MPTVGSLCSGIGGLDRGLHRAGWTDLRWACERVPHRREVLRRHWGADLRVFEDLEQLDPADLEPVDLLAAGTPCPDFSHAKAVRAGLGGDQSRLFWDFIRIRDALEPDWTIWENVDGALRTKVWTSHSSWAPSWAPASMFPEADGHARVWSPAHGEALSGAFSTLNTSARPNDAIASSVVGRLGGPCPPEILLEPARGGRDPAPRDEAPQDAARALGERVAGTLGAYTGGGGATRSQVIDGHGAYVAAGAPVVIAPDIANTLVASGADSPIAAREAASAYALRAGNTTDDPGTVVVPFRKAQKAHDAHDSERWEPADVAGTLAAGGGDANGTIVVAASDIAHTVMPKVRDGDRDENYAVAYQLRSNGSNSRVAARATETAGALLAAGARAGAGTTEETVVLLIGGVRRLTPTECERLQGLPDGWTIPWGPSQLEEPAWHELRDREPSLAVPWDPPTRLDTPRRSGCGDAVNAAVAEWIGRRLHTIASLDAA